MEQRGLGKPCHCLWIHIWPPPSWPLSNPPELLAEKMENQRKEHRPWAAALAAPQRTPRYLESNCSSFPCSPLAFQCISTLWEKSAFQIPGWGKALMLTVVFSMFRTRVSVGLRLQQPLDLSCSDNGHSAQVPEWPST